MRCGTHVYRGRHDRWACAGWTSGIELKGFTCCKLARLMDKYSKVDIGRIEMDPKVAPEQYRYTKPRRTLLGNLIVTRFRLH